MSHEDAIAALSKACAEVRQELSANGYESSGLTSLPDLRNALATMEADGNRLITLSRLMSGRLTVAEEREETAGPRY